MPKYIANLVGFAACLAAVAPVAGHACTNKNNPPIMVRKAPDGTVEVSEEVVRACERETLKWVFQGPDGEEMLLRFASADDSPFDWGERRGRTIEGTVRSGAAKQDPDTEYPYDVSIEGVDRDPKIIIER